MISGWRISFSFSRFCGCAAWRRLGSLLTDSRNQRAADGLDPDVAADVVEDEVAVELPIRPAPTALFGGPRHARDVARPRFHRGLVIRAELAEEQRPVLLLDRKSAV